METIVKEPNFVGKGEGEVVEFSLLIPKLTPTRAVKGETFYSHKHNFATPKLKHKI